MAYDHSTSSPVSLEAFFARLARHDWFYSYSDDGGAYHLGSDEQAQLERIARQSPEHEKLFRDFESYIMVGGEMPALPILEEADAGDAVTAADPEQLDRDPLLVALTDRQLADDLGTAAEIAKRSNARVERMKAEVRARGIRQAVGGLYIVEVKSGTRTGLDAAAVKRDMPPAWIAAHSKTSATITVNCKTR